MIKQFYFQQFILACLLFPLKLIVKIQSLNVKQFYLTHNFDPILIEDLGVMSTNEHTTFPKAPELLELNHQIV